MTKKRRYYYFIYLQNDGGGLHDQYNLEYKKKKNQKEMVNEGVEPSTLALLAPRSNQLS